MTSKILSSFLQPQKKMSRKKYIEEMFYIMSHTKKKYICYMHFFSSTVQSNNYYCHSVKCFMFLISPLFWFRQTISWCCVLCFMWYYYYLLFFICLHWLLFKIILTKHCFFCFAYTTREDELLFTLAFL